MQEKDLIDIKILDITKNTNNFYIFYFSKSSNIEFAII